MANNGVFCLEGEWDSDLRKHESVLPILELLERLGSIKAIHRDVATNVEAARYLQKFAQRRYDPYGVLYLAAHGDKGRIFWSRDQAMSLDDLGSILAQGRSGYYLYLGSCLTLFDTRHVERLVAMSGAQAVLGYRTEVDWIESAAFDVILLSWMANHAGRPGTLFSQLMKRHGQLAKHLKFVVATKDGVHRAQDHQPKASA